MSIIPEELQRINKRLEFLKKGEFTTMNVEGDKFAMPFYFFNRNYNNDILLFEAAASIPLFSNSASIAAAQILDLVAELKIKNISIFILVNDFITNEPDETGQTSPWIRNATDEIKKEWFDNLLKEISAYEILAKKYVVKSGDTRPLITENLARRIAGIEVGRKTFIHQNSVEDFIKIFTVPGLSDLDIKKIKIVIHCENDLAAFIFKTLEGAGILNLSFKAIEEYGCFYKTKGPYTKDLLQSYFSSFNKKVQSTNGRYHKYQLEVDAAIQYIKVKSNL